MFDAQAVFSATKASMPRLTCWDIGLQDTVVVEARITRYRTSKDPNKRWEWVTWRAGLTVQAVSLLHKYKAEEDDSAADEGGFTI